MFRSVLLIFLLALYFEGTMEKRCEMKNDCIPYNKCNSARERLNVDRNEKTRRLFREAFCGMENNQHTGNVIKVCCSEFEQTPKSVDSRLRLPDFNAMDTQDHINSDLSRNGDLGNTRSDASVDNEKEHPNLKLLPKVCGAVSESRIIGGVVAKLYEFPWMVLISYNEDDNLRFECGGSIINERYVLTAAHCVMNKNIAGVRIGEYDLRYEQDCEGDHCESHIQDIAVEKHIVHEEYEAHPDFANDIALLRVTKDIDMTYRNADPICLPVTRELRQAQITNKQATVTGWGLKEDNTDSSRLLKVVIPVHSSTTCQDYYRQMENPETKKFCAGIKKKDSCRGDSGGPLMIETQYNGTIRFVQFGIVSTGPIQCGTHSPGLYTDVRKYVDWILDKLEE